MLNVPAKMSYLSRYVAGSYAEAVAFARAQVAGAWHLWSEAEQAWVVEVKDGGREVTP